jgi:hypothetical protein
MKRLPALNQASKISVLRALAIGLRVSASPMGLSGVIHGAPVPA